MRLQGYRVLITGVALQVLTGMIMGGLDPLISSHLPHPINHTFILNHLNLLCLQFITFCIAVPLAIVVAVRVEFRLAAVFTAAIGVPLWVVVEDTTAHICFGSCLPWDWTHWHWAPVLQLTPTYWMPNWILILIIWITCMIGVLAAYERGIIELRRWRTWRSLLA